jgi:hypothetical protein
MTKSAYQQANMYAGHEVCNNQVSLLTINSKLRSENLPRLASP